MTDNLEIELVKPKPVYEPESTDEGKPMEISRCFQLDWTDEDPDFF